MTLQTSTFRTFPTVAQVEKVLLHLEEFLYSRVAGLSLAVFWIVSLFLRSGSWWVSLDEVPSVVPEDCIEFSGYILFWYIQMSGAAKTSFGDQTETIS